MPLVSTGVAGDTIRVTAGNGVSGMGGVGGADRSFVQIGNGGYGAQVVNLAGADGHTAAITVTANGAAGIDFKGGGGLHAYAQIGNGGTDADGDHSGKIHVSATGAGGITFAGGGSFAYAQIGHGGRSVGNGNFSGDITVSSADIVNFSAKGGSVAYSKIGHGGTFSGGNHSGRIDVSAGAAGVIFESGEYRASSTSCGADWSRGVFRRRELHWGD